MSTGMYLVSMHHVLKGVLVVKFGNTRGNRLFFSLKGITGMNVSGRENGLVLGDRHTFHETIHSRPLGDADQVLRIEFR